MPDVVLDLFPHNAAMCDRQLQQLTLRQVLCMVDCD